MQTKDAIESLIRELQSLYDNCEDISQKPFYSKLALLELCGWLESVQDDIALNYGRNNLSETKNIEFLEETIVGRTFGFDYKSQFRPMLIKIIGLTRVEAIETELRSEGNLQILVSQLGSLYSLRNSAAHTTIAGVMPTYNAPSTMLTYLNSLHPILSDLKDKLDEI
jgi:hypothetical protein